jgi:MFS family permease
MSSLTKYYRATGIKAAFVFATMLITPVLGPFLQSLGLSSIELGLVFSLMPLTIIFYAPIAGGLSDKVGRSVILRLGLMAGVAAISLYALSSSVVMMGIAKFLEAIAAATAGMMTIAKIEDSLEDTDRGARTGASLSLGYLGKLLAPLAGGLLADAFFVKMPFLVSIVILLVLLSFVANDKKRFVIDDGDLNPWRHVRGFLQHKRLKGMAILGMVMHASHPAIKLFLPIFVVDTLGFSFQFVGYAMFAMGVTHLLQSQFGKWADKNDYVAVLVGTVLSGTMMIVLGLIQALGLLIGVLFVRGTGNSIWNVSAWTLMSKTGERIDKEGEVVGAYYSLAKTGAFLSYIASGFVVTYFGIPTLFIVTGALAVFGSFIAFPFLKNQKTEWSVG